MWLVKVSDEVRRLAACLGRTFEHDGQSYTHGYNKETPHHITQVCPLCDARLGLFVEDTADQQIDRAQLHRLLFEHYDEHRCVDSTDAHTRFERAERALVTAAERIAGLSDTELRARAEAEADRMAAIAKQLGASW